MTQWWYALSSLNRAFYVAAVFFSTIFAWQFISSVSGLGGDSEELGGDADGDAGMDGVEIDADAADGADDLLEDAAGLTTFRMLSIRSLLAFGTLFSWAGALYLGQDSALWALIRAALWGAAGMLVVALFFWLLPRLTEEGTANFDTALGQRGQVYLNIPDGGVGQVKVIVSGAITFAKARSENGEPLGAGTMVRVVSRADAATLLVRAVDEPLSNEED